MQALHLLTTTLPRPPLFAPAERASAASHGPNHMQAPRQIIIDTDCGVDDAIAIAWLLNQPRDVSIIGFGTVAGNTSADNAARNVLFLQDRIGSSAPLAVGAALPLAEPLTKTGLIIHGPDGLWGVGAAHQRDIAELRHDIADFYAELACDNPGATMLALGPLTNVALAIQAHPQALQQLGCIVILGGAKAADGHYGPASDFNIGQDPEAADIVFRSGIPIVLVTIDTTSQVAFSNDDLAQIASASPLMQELADAIRRYAAIQTGLGGLRTAALPDPIAAVIAADPTIVDTISALAKVELCGTYTRGETLIGTSFSSKLLLQTSDREISTLVENILGDSSYNYAAAIKALATREPDNIRYVVITAESARAIRQRIIYGLG